MKEKRECKLVQDLLPNYIEKVTSEETNQYIQEHLQSCAGCTQVYTSMTREIKSKALDTDKTVDYMKKVNQKMKIAKVALGSIAIIILLVMLAFGANTLKNYRILEELRQTLKETQKASNYHVTMSQKQYNYGILVMDTYKKDEKLVSISQLVVIDGKDYKTVTYIKGNRNTSYSEGYNGGKYEKTVRVNENYNNDVEYSGPYNWFLEETETPKLWLSTRVKIEKTIYNEKECYVIEDDRFSKNPIIYYIEKDTGLTVRQVQYDDNTDYSYEFGNVADEVFIEPDIEEYELVEK